MNRSEAGKLGYAKSFEKTRAYINKRKNDTLVKFLELNKKCPTCQKPILYEKRRNDFCSQSCAAFYNNNKNKIEEIEKTNYCVSCEKKLNRNGKYCNQICQQTYQRNLYIEKWKKGEVSGGVGAGDILSKRIIHYLFKKYSNSCSKCGWNKIHSQTNKSPLETHHINGNVMDHKEENLELLCPNCHSLTLNYKGLNRGRGRAMRRVKR